MNARSCLRWVINPALEWLEGQADILPGGKPMGSRDEAKVLLLAIALQESGLQDRRQIGGPAAGLWQFERAGILGVATHQATRQLAAHACRTFLVVPVVREVHDALEYHDMLAAIFARLLLYSDPEILPANEAAAWDLYLRCWQPGRPRPHHWAVSWHGASDAVSRFSDTQKEEYAV